VSPYYCRFNGLLIFFFLGFWPRTAWPSAPRLRPRSPRRWLVNATLALPQYLRERFLWFAHRKQPPLTGCLGEQQPTVPSIPALRAAFFIQACQSTASQPGRRLLFAHQVGAPPGLPFETWVSPNLAYEAVASPFLAAPRASCVHVLMEGVRRNRRTPRRNLESCEELGSRPMVAPLPFFTSPRLLRIHKSFDT